jgi:ferrous iron transport protein B
MFNFFTTSFNKLENINQYTILARTILSIKFYFCFLMQCFSCKEETQHKSYLGQIGRFVQPVFAPLNFDTNASIALLTGVVAKEIVVATFGVLYAQGDEVDENTLSLRESIAGSMTALTAVSFMIFTLLYIPCMSTIAIMYRETQSYKWTGFSVVFSIALAYALAFAVTFFGELFV